MNDRVRRINASLAPGRIFSALRYRDFRLLWIGAFTSTSGTWMQTVAQSWVVYSITGSALLLGLDGFLGTIPMMLFSLFGGVLADRVERRRLMIVSQIAQMTFAFVLMTLVLLGVLEVWHIFVLSFLTGTAQAFSGPAYISLLPQLVRREDVPNAIAMNSMQFNLARVIGPVIGGFALTTFGAAICFGLNGLSFVAVIVALLMLPAMPPPANAKEKSISHDLADGFRFMKRNAAIAQLSLLAFLGALLGAPIITLLPVVAEQFDRGARGYSWLLAAYGTGSVLGALVVAWSGQIDRKGRIALSFKLVFALLLIVLAMSRDFRLTLVAVFLAGGALVCVIALYSSLVQLATGDEMRGRVMSIFMLAFRGGIPLGALGAGWVAEQFAVWTALAVNGVLLALVSSVMLAVHSRVREL